jgi:hypothetical protein
LAVAWPIPDDEPVINTVFLFMLFSSDAENRGLNDVTTTRLSLA